MAHSWVPPCAQGYNPSLGACTGQWLVQVGFKSLDPLPWRAIPASGPSQAWLSHLLRGPASQGPFSVRPALRTSPLTNPVPAELLCSSGPTSQQGSRFQQVFGRPVKQTAFPAFPACDTRRSDLSEGCLLLATLDKYKGPGMSPSVPTHFFLETFHIATPSP